MSASRSPLLALFIRLMSVARYRFIAELTLIFLGVWFGCALAAHWFEHGHNPKVSTVGHSIYAMLVTMTTSGDSAVVPQTVGGQWVLGFALLVSKLLTALLCALAAAVLIERKLKEDMGLTMHALSEHIVIIGWNLKGPQIIRTLRQEPALENTPIVVMADLEHKPTDELGTSFSRSPYPIRGESVERASLTTAATVVVLANYAEKQHADALSAVNVMVARRANPHARIVVELLDPGQRAFLEAAGADLVVGIGEVGGFLLAEATIGNEQARELLDFVADKGRQRQPAALK